VHKAATVTFNNSHIAQVINTQHRPNQNKKKEKENTFLLCKVCLQSNESLNTPSLPSSSTFFHSCMGSWLFVTPIALMALQECLSMFPLLALLPVRGVTISSPRESRHRCLRLFFFCCQLEYSSIHSTNAFT